VQDLVLNAHAMLHPNVFLRIGFSTGANRMSRTVPPRACYYQALAPVTYCPFHDTSNLILVYFIKSLLSAVPSAVRGRSYVAESNQSSKSKKEQVQYLSLSIQTLLRNPLTMDSYNDRR
jgi:hypothetical protein